MHFFQAAANNGQQSCWIWSTKKASIINVTNHHRQVSIAVAKVVIQVVTLILQRVERLVLDLPARTSTSHPTLRWGSAKPQQGLEDESEMSPPTTARWFLHVEKVDSHVRIRLVQRYVVRESIVAKDAVGINPFKLFDQTLASKLFDLLE